MTYETSKILEGLLYYRANQESLRDCIEIAKLNIEQNVKPIPHLEYEFLERFKQPQFLIIIDKLLYVYIFGEVEKGKMHYLSIFGKETEYHFKRIEAVKREILKQVRQDFNEYLPLEFYRKVIVLQPKGSILTDEDVICLTRNELTGAMTTKTTWSIKQEDYSVERTGFEMYLEELLSTLLKDIQKLARRKE